MKMSKMINIKNLKYKYKDSETYILNNLNLNINDGELIAIVGKNGSGKSTIAKLIAGLLYPSSGEIEIDNLNSKNKKDRKEIIKTVGMIFQNPENQIIFNDIEDELKFSLNNYSSEEREIIINDVLKQVNIKKELINNLYDLSLGQKQRIAIAEVIARKQKYIVFDEPTTMIDTTGKYDIYDIIKKLKQKGYTIIYITNSAEELLLADRIAILENGKIENIVKKENIIDNINILTKYDIKLPFIIDLINELKTNGITINMEDNNITAHAIVEKIKEEYKIEKK